MSDHVGHPPEKTPGSESIAMPPARSVTLALAEEPPVVSRPPWPRLELRDAVIEKNAVGHYYIVGYLPGGIRVAGWLHERPLPDAKEGENGTPT